MDEPVGRQPGAIDDVNERESLIVWGGRTERVRPPHNAMKTCILQRRTGRRAAPVPTVPSVLWKVPV